MVRAKSLNAALSDRSSCSTTVSLRLINGTPSIRGSDAVKPCIDAVKPCREWRQLGSQLFQCYRLAHLRSRISTRARRSPICG